MLNGDAYAADEVDRFFDHLEGEERDAEVEMLTVGQGGYEPYEKTGDALREAVGMAVSAHLVFEDGPSPTLPFVLDAVYQNSESALRGMVRDATAVHASN